MEVDVWVVLDNDWPVPFVVADIGVEVENKGVIGSIRRDMVSG